MSLASHRARSVAELVDATFTLYRAHFATLITVALLIIAPPSIIKVIAPEAFERIITIVGNLLLPLGQGAIAIIVAAAVEGGETRDAGDALRSATGRAGSLIAAQIASGLMIVIGFILLVVPGFIALAWTAVCIPVVMIEQTGYSKGIERSRALARGKWGHVLGTLVLSWGIALLLVIGAGVILGILGTNARIAGLLGELLFAVAFPVPAIAMAFLYYDLRVRTESADLDAMMSALPVSAPAP